jgi:hypothetical protein
MLSKISAYMCFFFDPTGQNPSISIKETANVYNQDKRKKKVRTDRQKAYNPYHNSDSRDAAGDPSDHAGPGSTDNLSFYQEQITKPAPNYKFHRQPNHKPKSAKLT